MHDQLVSFRQNEEFCEVTIDKDRCNALCGQNKASIKNASMRENSDFKEGITMRYFNDQVELQEADGVSLCGMPNPEDCATRGLGRSIARIAGKDPFLAKATETLTVCAQATTNRRNRIQPLYKRAYNQYLG